MNLASAKPSPSGLGIRAASALILAPVTILLIYVGGYAFLIMVLAAFLISVREWHGMVRIGPRPLITLAVGIVYFAACFLAFVLLRLGFPNGMWLTLTLLIAVWMSDVGAYFTGKTIGGPKLAPSISPKKTWAGLFGGMGFCGLALVLTGLAAPHVGFSKAMDQMDAVELATLFIAGCLLGIVGQAGDLLMSVFKRRVGLKDTGNLIPGHGGLLDRIDSLILASPAFLAISWLLHSL